MAGPRRTESLRQRLRGPWRLAIEQASMEPSISEGDWLLVDPTTARWPRRGSIVAFRQPDTGDLAVKRVGGIPGDRIPFREGYLELADDEGALGAPVGRARRGDLRRLERLVGFRRAAREGDGDGRGDQQGPNGRRGRGRRNRAIIAPAAAYALMDIKHQAACGLQSDGTCAVARRNS